MGSPLYVGIDLGTTNSTAALFDGETIQSVRNTQGGLLTPSVVRIDRRGNVQVGASARRLAESDQANTHAEFKRLMGTEHRFEFPAAAVNKTPVELSSLVLQALRSDIAAQVGVAPSRAVISVPALFELPQTRATSEAARLAGFEQVEMIQEPVASALASGWQRDDTGAWLVYDLGGGTFDASLLDTQDGLLRVVGHDGDNFLGGRDFDARIVDWMLAELAEQTGLVLDRRKPAHALPLRRLRLLAEEAKIELTRAPAASLICPNLVVDRDEYDIDLALSREQLDTLIAPLIERTLVVCRRLLSSKGFDPGALSRIVLVGGPTVIPSLRRAVAEGLGAELAADVDPMTVVAHGAALFAATSKLDARPAAELPQATGASTPAGSSVWLQHPAMTADLTPFVVGKLLSEASRPEAVVFSRDDGGWQSAPEPVADDGTFAAMVSLRPRANNSFSLSGLKGGVDTPLSPSKFAIIHGVALGEPPLSRSIGVALSNNAVQVYAERGAPLPLRRTFTHRTVEAVSPGFAGYALRIPIVQGEFPWAHLCRLVGVLELQSTALKAALPADSQVEVTLELDRGGQLRARAQVPLLEQTFDHIAQLVIAGSTPEEIEQGVQSARTRTDELRRRAFGEGDPHTLGQLADVESLLGDVSRLADAAHGGDADAAQQARRLLLEVAAVLDGVDAARAWPAHVEKVELERAQALSWIGEDGTDVEQKSAARTSAALDRALQARNAGEAERQLRVLRRLASAAYFRQPGSWQWEFESAAARVSETTNLRRAADLVTRGQRAIELHKTEELKSVVRELWQLLPGDPEERELSHHSGVR